MQIFRFISFKRKFLCTLEITRISTGEDVLSLSHAPVVFLTNPCNFISPIRSRSLPFGVRAWNFQFFFIPYPSFLLQLLYVSSFLLLCLVTEQVFQWRTKLPRFLTKPSHFCNIQIALKSQFYSSLSFLSANRLDRIPHRAFYTLQKSQIM